MGIHALKKDPGSWCAHCDIGKGCKIYDARPDGCRIFQCGYLTLPELDERFRPSTCHFVVAVKPEAHRIEIHVDQQRPDAWRKQPYYSWIKQTSRQAMTRNMVVIVYIGRRYWAIYPDRDADLGIARPGEQIAAKVVDTPTGPRIELYKTSPPNAAAAGAI